MVLATWALPHSMLMSSSSFNQWLLWLLLFGVLKIDLRQQTKGGGGNGGTKKEKQKLRFSSSQRHWSVVVVLASFPYTPTLGTTSPTPEKLTRPKRFIHKFCRRRLLPATAH